MTYSSRYAGITQEAQCSFGELQPTLALKPFINFPHYPDTYLFTVVQYSLFTIVILLYIIHFCINQGHFNLWYIAHYLVSLHQCLIRKAECLFTNQRRTCSFYFLLMSASLKLQRIPHFWMVLTEVRQCFQSHAWFEEQTIYGKFGPFLSKVDELQ